MRSQRAYLRHVLECIGRIHENASRGKEAFLQSHTLQDAIVRNIQVLCESVRRIDDSTKQTHPEIDWRAIAGMRNILVHDYFDVDLETVWDVIQRDLPRLKETVSNILAKTPD